MTVRNVWLVMILVAMVGVGCRGPMAAEPEAPEVADKPASENDATPDPVAQAETDQEELPTAEKNADANPVPAAEVSEQVVANDAANVGADGQANEVEEISESDALLQSIVAAQQGVEHVQGRFTQSTVQADDADAEPNVQHVQFSFHRPDRYFLLYEQAIDPDEKQWFLSNGVHQWHAEQLFAGDAPIVNKNPVDKDSWGFHRVIDFFRMDLDGMREDFELSAQRLATSPLEGAAIGVDLKPRKDDLAQELRGIQVLVTDSFQTRGVIITDGQDNVITIDVTEADYASQPDAGLFTWPE